MILPESSPISQLINFPLGLRSEKHRSSGFTVVTDGGLGCCETEDLKVVWRGRKRVRMNGMNGTERSTKAS